MSDLSENTLSAYYGTEFQMHLLWQLLVEPEFAEKILPVLAVEYFDSPHFKRLFIIIFEYYKEFGKVPNLQNQSIKHAINKYKTPNNLIEEESLFSELRRIELWNDRVINKQLLHSGDVIQKETFNFIKQQEYRKLGEFILDKTKTGEIRNKKNLFNIEERFQKISHIGEEDDDCEEVIDNISRALRKEFRKTIPTGVEVIDALTGGGLGKGEIGVILTPSGVGKTTLLTKIANTAYEGGYNVAQVIFEDTQDQVKRKHYSIWSKTPLSKIDENLDYVTEISEKRAAELRGNGRLLVKRFSQENTTIVDIRNWMTSYQKKFGIKFDLLILDYLDCLESHKHSPDRNEAELAIVKGFEALASDFDIPAWTAIQTNRSGFDAEFVEAHQSGGSIKRIQKAHFFMSVAKTPDQKQAGLANIRIIKARFAQDGQTFNDCIFNNDTLEIRIEDDRYKYNKLSKGQKHHDSSDIDKLENNINKMHVAASNYMDDALSRANDDAVNDAVFDNLRDTYIAKNNTDDVLKLPEITNNVDEVDDDNAVLQKIYQEAALIDYDNSELLEFGEPRFDVESDVIESPSTVLNDSEFNLIGWNGESGKTTVEIINMPSIEVKNEPKRPVNLISGSDINEVEKLLSDPDEVERPHMGVHEMLQQARKNQDVMKKD
jgi:replicative DNA helicase